MGHPNVWQLASLAQCGEPDSSGSPGADFLVFVRDAVQEHIENAGTSGDRARDFDDLHEIVDGCVPVQTHEVWKAFVDLTAYNERDIDGMIEYHVGQGDMTRCATAALYQIGERLAYALWGDRSEGLTDDE